MTLAQLVGLDVAEKERGRAQQKPQYRSVSMAEWAAAVTS